jgi:aryl-alcohol dehydrogenase-like predicted oxidoreductase
MDYVNLGRSGLKISRACLGAMNFGVTHTAPWCDEQEARRIIGAFLDAGGNFIDTANNYTGGQSEEVVGRALKGRRDEVVIATKARIAQGPGPNDQGLSRLHLTRALDASLKRLGVDYIDLYQMHSFDADTPIEETMDALTGFVRAGKVRYIGSSNHAGWTQMRALATSDRLGLTRYISQQIKYSLLDRDSESELLPLGVHEGVGALIWGPLSSGYLSGKFRQAVHAEATRLGKGGRLESTDTEQARGIVELLAAIAKNHAGASISQVALNWVARKPGVSSIIVGARTSEQLADNLAAAQWSLSDEEITRLDDASAVPIRYPYQMHRNFGSERNPITALLPTVSQA